MSNLTKKFGELDAVTSLEADDILPVGTEAGTKKISFANLVATLAAQQGLNIQDLIQQLQTLQGDVDDILDENGKISQDKLPDIIDSGTF